MRDIRKPYRNSKSREREISPKRAERSSFRNIDEVEDSVRETSFNKNEIRGDIEYTREGRPMIKASSHFDMRPPERELRHRGEDFDVLKRSEFFNTNRKTDFDSEEIREYKNRRKKKKRSKKVILFLLLALVLGGLVAWTFLFNRAEIFVNPKYKDVEINGSFLIFKEDIETDFATSSLSRTVLKSAPKEVNQKASGELTIYNNYSPESQVLIKNTRFQTEDGKVYRIGESVTVPGKVGNNPGSIKVKVSADAYGAEYNIGPTDFTIPGFKGTERYAGFYAKSTSPMTGGLSGMVQIVSDADIESANNDLRVSIENDIKEKAKLIKREGYVTLYNNPIITYTDNRNDLIMSEKNSYELTGSATILSIKEGVLAKLLASHALGDAFNELENVRLDNPSNLIFELDKEPPEDSNLIKVSVLGPVRIVWVYDSQNIKESLVGKKISALDDIIQNHKSSIVSTTLKLTPSWTRNFPSSVDRIKIIEELK